MKVVYVNTFYAPDEVGGAEKSVRFLAETVVANGHEATVICLGRERETTELNGVRIERLPIANSYFPLDASQKSGAHKMLWHLRDSYNSTAGTQIGHLIDQIQPDVAHTNNLGGFSVAAWSAIKQRGVRIVHTLRDYYLLCPNTAMFSQGQQCNTRCSKCAVMGVPRAMATKHVDVVVGNSKFILNKHLQYGLFRHSDQEVIYNAYEPKSTTPNRPSDYVHFGYIGRLAPTKGVEVLIAAIKQLVEQGQSGFKVSIAGDGDPEYVSQLKHSAIGLPISFLGKVKPEDFYNQVHWTVVPSIWDEPLARVLFESFAHGVPVIGSATGGTPELIVNDTNGQLYLHPHDHAALASLITSSINSANIWPKFSKQCEMYGKNFAPNFVYENYTGLYHITTSQTN